MADIIIYLKYDGVLKFSIKDDAPDKFSEMKEDSWVGFDDGDTLTWKLSQEPGELEKIKVKDVKKKDGIKLRKGSWKDSWRQKPKKVSDIEYTGKPNGEGATKDNPFAFAYDIDYKITSEKKWKTLDPGGWTPPPPPGVGDT